MIGIYILSAFLLAFVVEVMLRFVSKRVIHTQISENLLSKIEEKTEHIRGK